MIDQPKTLLWQLLHQRLLDNTGTIEVARTCEVLGVPVPDAQDWSDVLRAVADWLVPETTKPIGPATTVDFVWHEQRQLRQLLLAEADRAEAGE